MIRKMEADERRPSRQLAELLAEVLNVAAEERDSFVQFARGLAIEGPASLATAAGGAVKIPHNLPAQATPFIGRQEELSVLQRYLDDPGVRLVTILGPGGMGKTRLALATAEGQLGEASPSADGVRFVTLAGVSGADQLPQAIGAALDFQFSGADDPRDQLLRYLRGKKLLLLLDNYEHLLPDVRLLAAILHHAPGVQLLVTSREKLHMQAEQLLPIGGLAFPEEKAGLCRAEMETYSALQLFVQCARRARPDFDLRGENGTAAAAICRQLEGMPLGIVLAAAWIDTLTAGEIVRQIEASLDFLSTEMSDVPPRQRSLRAAFDHSWQLLSAREKSIYGQISVFRGGFAAEAASEVAGAALQDLRSLLNKSLLARAPSASGNPLRYEVHELLRQFAGQELAKDVAEQEAARERHSAYYLALLARTAPDWKGERQLQVLDLASRESDNINAALRQALQRGSWAHLHGALESWAVYLNWRGLVADGRELCETITGKLRSALERGAGQPPEVFLLQAEALAWGGIFSGNTSRALAKLEESMAILDGAALAEVDTRPLRAFILLQMAIRRIPVDQEAAHRLARESLDLALAGDDRWQAADCYQWLGSLDWRAGRVGEARRQIEASLALFEELGDRRMQVQPLNILAWLVQHTGAFARAETIRHQALRLCRQIGDRTYLPYCMYDLAFTLMCLGKRAEARQMAGQTVEVCEAYGLLDKVGFALGLLGYIHLRAGEYGRADRRLRRALALTKESGNRDVEAYILATMGRLELVAGKDLAHARECFRRALDIHEQTHDIIYLPEKLVGMGLTACLAADLRSARRYLRQALQVELKLREYSQLLELLEALALYRALEGDVLGAVEIWTLAGSHPYLANSKWSADVIGRPREAMLEGMDPAAIAAARERGRQRDVWQTVEALHAALEDA